MTQKWKNFEKDCVKYLNDTYYKYASFVRNGGENSKQPDIIATTKSGSKIILEVKCPSSQGFQFTLLPNDESKKFIYTAELKENASIHAIKKYMENSYDIYKSTNSAGISIPINDNIFYEHAKNYSFQKNIDFFISKYKEQFILFPPYHMEYYFSITSKYRKKNSGSGNPGQKYKSDIEKQLKSFSPTFSLHMGNSKTKTFVNITTNLDKQYLYGTLATYYCRLNSSNNYRITKCSNTSNPTVIFQLKTKGYQRDEDLKIFLDKINNI